MEKINNLINSLTIEDLFNIRIIEFKKGEVLYNKDQTCEEIVIITSGEIQMVNFDINGNETIFNYLYSPAIFGNNLIFSSYNKYLSDVIATKKGKGYIIKKDKLLKIMQKNNEFLNIYLQILADKTINLTQRMKIISIQNARKRLLSYLYFKADNNMIIKITSVTSFAKELSLTREATSRLLYALVDEGIISFERKYIKINKNVLELI